MGSPYQGVRASQEWLYWRAKNLEREGRNLGIPESATERHHREWAEGLEKYPQRASDDADMPPRAPVRPSAPWYRGYDDIAPKEGEVPE